MIGEAITLAENVPTNNQPRIALVLGPGPAADIPLEELARTFDRVDLVEYAPEATHRAIQALPENLQGKCSVIQADLTQGVISKLPVQWGHLFQEKYPLAAEGDKQQIASLIVDMQKQIDEMTLPDVTIDTLSMGDYSLVVSQLITSQLNLPAQGFFNMAFPTMVAQELLRRQHFALMQRASKPEGILYWADTTDLILTYPDGRETKETICRSDIPPSLPWQLLRENHWVFRNKPMQPDITPPEPAKAFSVVADIFRVQK